MKSFVDHLVRVRGSRAWIACDRVRVRVRARASSRGFCVKWASVYHEMRALSSSGKRAKCDARVRHACKAPIKLGGERMKSFDRKLPCTLIHSHPLSSTLIHSHALSSTLKLEPNFSSESMRVKSLNYNPVLIRASQSRTNIVPCVPTYVTRAPGLCRVCNIFRARMACAVFATYFAHQACL